MNKTEEIVAFTVRLAKGEHEALAELAKAEHRSLGAETRRAVIAHLERAKQDQAA